jgi:hypothetical protein
MTQQLIPSPQMPARELSACRKGELAETLFIAGAMAHDWDIFTPFGHAQTADLCLVRPGVRPITVQVKTGTLDRAAYHVSVKRSNRNGNTRPYAAGDFDVLAAYLPDRNQFVLWTFADILGRISVRYSPEKHRQPGNWHLLDEVAESLTAHQKSFTP